MGNCRNITTMAYDVEDFLGSCVTRYLELAGKDTKLKPVNAPFLPEETKDGPAGRPSSADGVEIMCPHCSTVQAVSEGPCSWCKKGFVPRVLPTPPKQKAKAREDASSVAKPGVEPTGRLATIVARVQMKLLYAARLARFDLRRAVCHLACFVTKWDPECDARLHRLMCYVNSAKHLRMFGWVGDDRSALQPHLFCGSDFAGCPATLRSTSGVHLAIRGPNACVPVSGVSKRQ